VPGFKAFAPGSKPWRRHQRLTPATAILDRVGHSESNTYASLSGLGGGPVSTIRHRDHGRPSMQQKDANQQYLKAQKEKALVTYLLRMSRNGYPLLVKF